MSTDRKSRKKNPSRSGKAGKSRQDSPAEGQNHVRKLGQRVPAQSIESRLQINLGHLVKRLSVGGKVQAYELIALRLSALVGLNNGHTWGWRYVASVHSGSITPSKKFARAVALYLEDINPRQKQWFYFARRHSVAALYEKTILGEIIRMHLNGMGYKAVTHSRYVEIKRMAIQKHVRRPA